jgi:arginase family enzyme
MNQIKNKYFITMNDSTHKLVKEDYDLILEKEKENDNENTVPKIYQNLKQHIDKLDINTNIPITISSDKTLSVSTIASLNEKFMVRHENTFTSDLKIIYFTDCPSLEVDGEGELNQFILSSLFGLTDETIIKSNLILQPNQLMLIGLNKQNYTEEQQQLIEQYEDIKYLTNDRINKIGIDKLLYSIKNFINYSPIHIIINLTVLNKSFCPSVKRNNNDYGLIFDDLIKIIKELKKQNIIGLDILGFDTSLEISNKTEILQTAELVRQIYIQLFDIKGKTINIFNEFSRFIIYRTLDDNDKNNDENDKNNDENDNKNNDEDEDEDEDDFGWRILRNIPNELKESLINFINSEIKTIQIDDEDILVAVTNMEEQEQKSYYTSTSIFDLCLYPEEKISMMFELVN